MSLVRTHRSYAPTGGVRRLAIEPIRVSREERAALGAIYAPPPPPRGPVYAPPPPPIMSAPREPTPAPIPVPVPVPKPAAAPATPPPLHVFVPPPEFLPKPATTSPVVTPRIPDAPSPVPTSPAASSKSHLPLILGVAGAGAVAFFLFRGSRRGRR